MSIQIYKYVSPCGRVIPVKAANTFIKRFFGLMGKKREITVFFLNPASVCTPSL